MEYTAKQIENAKSKYDAFLIKRTSGNQFRKEHFSKKYTQESVNAFLNKQ